MKMFQTLDGFLKIWNFEAYTTKKILDQLTDESLSQETTPQNWNLGRIAWHTATAIGVIASQTGLAFEAPSKDYPVPQSAKFISDIYQKASSRLAQAIKEQWTDMTLSEEKDFFGQRMSNGQLLLFIIQHQTHHRGQMTILMRQAGLSVPGVYGPAKEEWAMMGMEAPQM
jgi:uncharacterized damage-inducible protein DinB